MSILDDDGAAAGADDGTAPGKDDGVSQGEAGGLLDGTSVGKLGGTETGEADNDALKTLMIFKGTEQGRNANKVFRGISTTCSSGKSQKGPNSLCVSCRLTHPVREKTLGTTNCPTTRDNDANGEAKIFISAKDGVTICPA